MQNVYCGHEYTTANLKFGLHVEPDNQDIINALAEAQKQRSKSPPEHTVPSTIGKPILSQNIQRSLFLKSIDTYSKGCLRC